MKSFDCKECKVSAQRSIFLTGLFKKFSRRGEAQTDNATVLSHRIASARFPTPGSTWDHWVTFRLSDGSEAELLTPEEIFHSLKNGVCGTLTWQGENFLRFDEKE